MRYSLVTATLWLSSAIAIPHNKPHHSSHHDNHHPKPSFSGTAKPIATGTGVSALDTNAPYPTRHPNDDHGTASHPLETSPEMPQPIADKHAKPDSESPDSEECGPNTVTVTSQLTRTVTVAAESAPASSAAPSSSSANPSPVPQQSEKSEDKAPKQPSDETSGNDDSNDNTAPSSQPSAVAKPVSNPKPAPSSAAAPAASASATAQDSADTQEATKPSSSNNKPAAGGQPFKTKRGLIASGNTLDALSAAAGVGKISWLGDWFSGPPKTLPDSLTFVPQNYGKKSDVSGTWTKNAEKAVKDGSKYFFSFGEPKLKNDLHLEPNEAVALWREKMEPYAKQGVTIGAPGTLQPEADFAWLASFLEQCTDCTIGFLAIHWFWHATPLADMSKSLKDTMQRAKDLGDKYGVPVWLDNFYADGSVEEQKAFLSEVVPWLDDQDYIKAYAYVPSEVGKAGSGPNFIDGNSGPLNDLGSHYANL